MSHNLSRRDMLKGTAAGAVGLAAGLAPGAILASAPSQDVVQLRFSENEARWTPVVEAFAELFPGTEVEFLNISGIDHEEIAAKILSLLASGQPLDAGYAATEATVLYAGQGVASSLTDRVLDAQDELAEYFLGHGADPARDHAVGRQHLRVARAFQCTQHVLQHKPAGEGGP